MSWFKQKLDGLGKRKDAERRVPRQVSLSQVEQLESRLCLGSLNAPDLGDWSPDDPNNSALEPAAISTDLSQDDTTQVEPDGDGQTQSQNTSQTETVAASGETNTDYGQTTSLLGVGLETDQTQIQLTSADSPRRRIPQPSPAARPIRATRGKTNRTAIALRWARCPIRVKAPPGKPDRTAANRLSTAA